MGKMKSNIIYNLTYQILILALPLISAPYLSRVLGVEGVGTYSYVFSVAYYFYIFITSGLSNYGNRTIAKVKDNKDEVSKKFWSIYFMQLSIGVLSIIAYVVYVILIVDCEFKLFFFAFIPYVLSAAVDISWFYFGILEFKFTTTRNTVVKVLSLAAVFLLVKSSNDLLIYFVIMTLTYFLSNILLWTRIKKKTTFYRPLTSEVFAHIKPNYLLFIPTLALSIYRVMDKIMIKELSDVIELGYYENADKIIMVAMTVFSAVATVMMPSVSNMVEQKKDTEVRTLLRDTMQIGMFMAFGMMFGLVAIGKFFAPVFYGEQFIESGILIQLLAPTVVLSGWKAILRSQYIIPYEKDMAYVASLVAGAIMNVLFNLVFIPIFKARGAVIGTFAAELIGFGIQTLVVSREIDVRRMIKDGGIFIIPGIVMACIVYAYLSCVPVGVISLCMAILIGIGAYCTLSIIILYLFDKRRLQYYVCFFISKKPTNNTMEK